MLFDWRIVRHVIANKSTIARYVTHRAFFVPFTVHFSFHPKSTIARCVKHHCVRVSLVMQQCYWSTWMLYKTNNECFSFVQQCEHLHSLKDGMFSASLNRSFHLSTHKNIRTIALTNIHYLYTNYTLKMSEAEVTRILVPWGPDPSISRSMCQKWPRNGSNRRRYRVKTIYVYPL